jgi:energy-coupling factor transporter ATP-binding protein EcfA2
MKNDGVTAHDLAELMVGSELPTPDTSESTVTDEVALELRDLAVRNEDGRQVVHDINLRIHRGEIVGIAGVEGNGQGELVDAIIGTADISNGSIAFHGRDITNDSVRKRREQDSPTSPRIGTRKACCSRHRSGRTPPSAIRPRHPTAPAGGSTEVAHASRPSGFASNTTSAPPTSTCQLTPSPVVTSKSSSSVENSRPTLKS